MLSLPLIAPQNEYILHLSPQLQSAWSDPHSTHPHHQPHLQRPHSSSQNDAHNSNPSQQNRHQNRHSTSSYHPTHTRNSLAQLLADESAIAHRKHNIRQFGAGWIKPPGVGKTLQAELEERAEREEQEVLARREQVLLDLQARQEVEEARARAVEGAGGGGVRAGDGENVEGVEEGERDLDEEIPDAEDTEEDDEDEDESENEDEEESDEDAWYSHATPADMEATGAAHMEHIRAVASVPGHGFRTHLSDDGESYHSDPGDVTFNDDSLLLDHSYLPLAAATSILPSTTFAAANGAQDDSQIEDEELTQEEARHVRLAEAELTGITRDQFDLGIERDLDDSVPEAGSYEHTDSEAEITSSEDESEEEGEQSHVEADGRGNEGHGDDHEDASAQSISEVMRRPTSLRQRRSLARQESLRRRSGRSATAMDATAAAPVSGAQNRRSGGDGRGGGFNLRDRRQIRISDSERSLLNRDVSSLLESSFLDSSPVVGRLRSGNHRGGGGGYGDR